MMLWKMVLFIFVVIDWLKVQVGSCFRQSVQEDAAQKRKLSVPAVPSFGHTVVLVVGDVVKHILQPVELVAVEQPDGTERDLL